MRTDEEAAHPLPQRPRLPQRPAHGVGGLLQHVARHLQRHPHPASGTCRQRPSRHGESPRSGDRGMTTEKVDQLFGYVQERCLWQFFSRTWDRKENIEGIMKTATELLSGGVPKLETPMDKLFYADAKIMVADFKERFPWIKDTAPAEIATLMQGLKDRVKDISITKSLNHELNHSLY